MTRPALLGRRVGGVGRQLLGNWRQRLIFMPQRHNAGAYDIGITTIQAAQLYYEPIHFRREADGHNLSKFDALLRHTGILA